MATTGVPGPVVVPSALSEPLDARYPDAGREAVRSLLSSAPRRSEVTGADRCSVVQLREDLTSPPVVGSLHVT